MAKKKRSASDASLSVSKPDVQPKVDYCREEVSRLLPAYYLIRDAIEGEQAIKGLIGSASAGVSFGNGGFSMVVTNISLARAKQYLPQPNAEDQSAANTERYRAYVTRAVFYEVTGRTLEGMVGQVFLRDPVVDLPTKLQIMVDDADGSGITLNQISELLVRYVTAWGRSGILVDYPVMDQPATVEDIESGEVKPTFTVYFPWDIINWRVERDGAKTELVFLVLREHLEQQSDDGFQIDAFEQYRVLSLEEQDDGSISHKVETYRKDKNKKFTTPEVSYPKNADGSALDYIPFKFVGAENNGVAPCKPPMYGVASLNIAHYRNSADYEESCFLVGQPTPVLTGLTDDWVKNVLKGTVTLGSRASIPLPTGATAELLQAAPNSMPFEAMNHKEEQMAALGAKLIQNRKTAETATAKIIDTTSESSVLANISKNVSMAIVWALGVAADYIGETKDKIKYVLNKDFDLTSMTADDQNATIKEWQSGAIAFSEMRTVMRRAGIATLSDAEAETEIQDGIDKGMIPDPALANAAPGASDPKGSSGAGGPQPKRVRRQPSPAGSK